MFRSLAVPILKVLSQRRVEQILIEHSLNDQPIPFTRLRPVSSANDAHTHSELRKFNPPVVVVNGTRILSSETRSCVQATFVNIHTGITPKYRGVHGAYWSLVQGDGDHCGVTVHLVDDGTDTGGVLAQVLINPVPQIDNFTTYPYLQLAAFCSRKSWKMSSLVSIKRYQRLQLTRGSGLILRCGSTRAIAS